MSAISRLRRLTMIALSAMLASSSLSRPAAAHPDIAVSVRVLFDMRDGRLSAIGESWGFDAVQSERLLRQYDRDGDHRFNPGEVEAFRQGFNADLAPLQFLTEVTLDGTRRELPAPEAFDAANEAGTVIATFFFRFAEPLDIAPAHRLSMQVKDPDYAADMRFVADRPAIIRNDPDGRCSATLSDRPDAAYFGGQVIPQEITLRCR